MATELYLDGRKVCKGDPVFSILHGWGIVDLIYQDGFRIHFRRWNRFLIYQADGYYHRRPFVRSLYWDIPDILPPVPEEREGAKDERAQKCSEEANASGEHAPKVARATKWLFATPDGRVKLSKHYYADRQEAEKALEDMGAKGFRVLQQASQYSIPIQK